MAPAELEVVPELSTPGELCIYHVDMDSEQNPLTDIALFNGDDKKIKFPHTSTVTIGVNKITEQE